MLGHYRLVERIGAGGMGVVFRAHDERLDRDIALKVLRQGVISDEVPRKRFRKEALTLSKLSHPNIATVYDFDRQRDVDFLVMELIPGVTLDKKIAAQPVPEKDVILLGEQIARALQEAHEHGIVHRDLKPRNIMVTPKGQVKVLDFGLAKLIRASEADATESLIDAGSGAGKLPYMAPEQLQLGCVDTRTDIYAAGAVLYEMATGRRPHPEPYGAPLLNAILNRAPDKPSKVNPSVSAGLEAIILKAIEKEPLVPIEVIVALGMSLLAPVHNDAIGLDAAVGGQNDRAEAGAAISEADAFCQVTFAVCQRGRDSNRRPFSLPINIANNAVGSVLMMVYCISTLQAITVACNPSQLQNCHYYVKNVKHMPMDPQGSPSQEAQLPCTMRDVGRRCLP